MKRAIIYTFLACAGLPAVAEPPVKWGDGTAGWEVFVDADKGDACFIRKEFEDGLRIEFGMRPLQEGGYFAALRTDWDQLEPGSTWQLRLRFDEDVFGGDAEVISDGDWVGVYAFFDNPELAGELARKRDVAVYAEGTEETIIDLVGTSASFARVRECQDAQTK